MAEVVGTCEDLPAAVAMNANDAMEPFVGMIIIGIVLERVHASGAFIRRDCGVGEPRVRARDGKEMRAHAPETMIAPVRVTRIPRGKPGNVCASLDGRRDGQGSATPPKVTAMTRRISRSTNSSRPRGPSKGSRARSFGHIEAP